MNKQPLFHTGPNLMPAYDGDAGFDLVTAKDHEVEGGSYSLVPCEVRVEFPDGYWGWITGRSSTIQNFGLLVLPGIIDTGYRGELFVAVLNLNQTPVTVSAGQRIGQLIMMKNHTQEFDPEQVLALDESTSRGANGFGSSGK